MVDRKYYIELRQLPFHRADVTGADPQVGKRLENVSS